MARWGAGREPPPRWVLRSLWALHRVVYAVSLGRIGLRQAGAERLGVLRLRTLGRRSGQERSSMLYYLEDGRDLAVVASNAGAPNAPAWWLNLQAAPEAFVDLSDGIHSVTGRAADAAERQRLWSRFAGLLDDYDTYAATTERSIPVVILEPADLSKPVRSRG
ncbi:MAG: nitroreductase/quinone reductase family protein [Chloroflexota bacterium]